MSQIEIFKIESESEADAYLKELLEKEEYRSMDEVKMRSQKFIEDENLKNYFIDKARGILKSYGHVE